MEQMIDFCAQYVDEFNCNTGQHLTADEYKEQLRQYFPQLKRWKKYPAPHRSNPITAVAISGHRSD